MNMITGGAAEVSNGPPIRVAPEGGLQREQPCSALGMKICAGNLRVDGGPYQSGVSAEFIRRGWVQECGGARVAYSGPVLRLARLVSEKAAALYLHHFNAVESCYPGGQTDLCPGPAYPVLEGVRINAAGAAVTWQGRVSRDMSPETCDIDRLSEFTTREIAFAGTEGFIANRRKRALPLIGELAQAFDLDMESASGPSAHMAPDTKTKILLPVLDGKGGTLRLACGSMKMHGRMFGERFNITASDGAPAHTFCIRLGLERWVLAAFTQHGFDPMRWPEDVRDAVFG